MGYSTQQARNAYPELVVGGVTSTWYVTGTRPRCDYSSAVRVAFDAGAPGYPPGGTVNLLFHPAVAEWARACAAVFRAHGYTFNETAGGSVSCRKITGGGKTSLHAHGVCFDINPSKNRYRISVGYIQWGVQTDMPKTLIADLEAIRTVDGYKVTEWGGRWWNIKDPMHFQPTKCTRAQLERGIDWSTVNGEGDDEMRLARGAKGSAVAELQKMMAETFGLDNGTWTPFAGKSLFDGEAFDPGEDADFGGTCETNVKRVEQILGRPQTGVVDQLLWDAMVSRSYGATADLTGYATKRFVNQQIKTHADNPDAHHE